MWLSIGKRIFKIGSVDPTPYTSQTLPLYNNSIDNSNLFIIPDF